MPLTKSKPAARTGGRLLADALVAQGVDHVFSVPGESFLDLLDGLYAVKNSLTLITCRFEAGAGNMAEAYGKLTGKPGVAVVTRGPGACHAAISVHIAQQDSTPMVLFVGQIPTDETDRESFQEVDYRRFFGPIAKWVTQIDQPSRVPELVAHAFDVARSGRPGPVVIAIPEDMQRAEAAVPDLPPATVHPPHPDPAALAAMMALLGKASRPLAILGGGGWTPAGRAAIARFLRANHLPVAVGFRRQALYDGTHATYVGDLGVGSDPALVAKVRDADLVLAIGTRLGEAVTQGYTLLDLAGATPLVHVHPQHEEIGRVHRPALGIVSDLNAFAAAAQGMPPAAASWREWTAELRTLRETALAVPDYPEQPNVAACMRALQAQLPADAIVTCDAGNFATWANRFLSFGDRQRFIGPTNGAMGYGVPAAIGAAAAFPGRTVVALVGDGGALMTGQEIATAFHHGLNPVVIVFNNQMFGTIRMYQERAFPARVSGTALTNPDFARFIEAFGGHGEVVSRTDEFAPALARALAAGKPALIEVRQHPDRITSRATIADLRAAGGGVVHAKPAAAKRAPVKRAPKVKPAPKR